jgi:hypothetical protein
MINKDKFGNPIYKQIFDRLLIKGQILSLNGYRESYNSPNLFVKKIPEGAFFADMIGTELVPIWSDMVPLFYWKFSESVSMWKRRRMISEEFAQLSEDGCTCRLSYEIDYDATPEFQGTSTMRRTSYAEIEWLNGDGYCAECKKDIQSEDEFCSEECMKKHDSRLRQYCLVCKESEREMVKHHVCYDPEITITVCRSCHNVIHKSNTLPCLKPR